MSNGWIGVDLDGTLAEYKSKREGGQGIDGVGPPIPAMLERVQRWLAEGREVRILTARVCGEAGPEDEREQRGMINDWLVEHVGVSLAVTCRKDFSMIELWDDRATGRVLTEGREDV